MDHDNDPPRPRSADARAGVAGEMAAIFGDGQRLAMPACPVAKAPARRPSGRRPAMAVLLLGALGVSIAGGVMLGRDAVGPPASVAGVTTLAPRSAAPARDPVPVASIAPVALAPVVQPTPAEEAAPAVVASAEPPAPVRATPQPRVAAVARAVTAPVPGPATAPYARPDRADRVRCFGDVDCLNVRLYDTDGEVARAYAAATSAGVGARTLREYRSEWLRARDLAERRPREALRIYGMIAADLFDLAQDAEAGDRMPRS